MKNNIIVNRTAMIRGLAMGCFSLLSMHLIAQETLPVEQGASLGDRLSVYTIIIVSILAVWALSAIVKGFDVLVRMRELNLWETHGMDTYIAQHEANQNRSWYQRFSSLMTGAVPLEREGDVLLDHNYDGIKELDNNLPPWWLYGFYCSILVSIIYVAVQHFSPYGHSMHEEYEIEMAEAKAEIDAYLAKQANAIDETNVTYVEEVEFLEAGKELFTSNCAACHLNHGGGAANSVGPNLTDAYWIHGGGIKNIFKTIKHGVPEKGMIAWKTQMPPSDMHKLASFIMSIQGTNPPGAKDPQGDLYEATEEAESTTTEGDATGAVDDESEASDGQ